jgi:hypothetical protein
MSDENPDIQSVDLSEEALDGVAGGETAQQTADSQQMLQNHINEINKKRREMQGH